MSKNSSRSGEKRKAGSGLSSSSPSSPSSTSSLASWLRDTKKSYQRNNAKRLDRIRASPGAPKETRRTLSSNAHGVNMKLSLIAVLFALTSSFQVPDINFTPESEEFSEAVREYQTIWIKEGKRMIEAMEIVSRLKFKEKNITAIVYEGVSWSGSGSSPMKLRASYPSDVKK